MNTAELGLRERLRVLAAVAPGGLVEWAVAAEAADEIERQDAKLNQIRQYVKDHLLPSHAPDYYALEAILDGDAQ